MLFNSLVFIPFFVGIYLLYLIPNRIWQNRLLLVGSYIFYGAWDWRFLSLLFISTIVDYFVGLRIHRSTNESTRKRWLVLSACSNLGMLGFFKYFDFFAESLQTMLTNFGFGVEPWHLSIVLPVGISFYTFQTMSYTIDVYRGKMEPTRNILDFALYISFFPQLVAGPIERASHLMPQILAPRKISSRHLQEGAWLILLGYFQKIYVADNLAPIVNSIFSRSETVSGPVALLGVYCFAFQIYGDFAGYSNIARGLSRLMGIDLMRNFRTPYFSTSPSDFWKRWHISLSSWLRDYLYIPLGGNRHGSVRTVCNLMITMLLGGLWHGAGWTFVLWGFFHGVILAIYRPFEKQIERICSCSSINHLVIKVGLIVLMFHLVCISWLLFRAESVSQAVQLFGSLFTHFSFSRGEGLGNVIPLIYYSLPLVLLDVFRWKTNDTYVVFRWPICLRTFIYVFMVLAVLIYGNFGSNEFIYFQF